jgi:hypothetical protein
MPPFALLLGNIWFRRAALAVMVTIALLGVRQHYINMGNRQGHTDEANRPRSRAPRT